MKKLLTLLSVAAAASLVMAAPASAQIFLGAEASGAGVQARPYNPGPAYHWGNAYGAYGYSGYPYSGYSSYPYGSYGYTGNAYAYADPSWILNRSPPGGYANGAMGGPSGYGSSGNYGYGSYAYGGYEYPGGYGAYGYTTPYAAGNAFAFAPGAQCRRIRERVTTRNGRTIYRTRSSCE